MSTILLIPLNCDTPNDNHAIPLLSFLVQNSIYDSLPKPKNVSWYSANLLFSDIFITTFCLSISLHLSFTSLLVSHQSHSRRFTNTNVGPTRPSYFHFLIPYSHTHIAFLPYVTLLHQFLTMSLYTHNPVPVFYCQYHNLAFHILSATFLCCKYICCKMQQPHYFLTKFTMSLVCYLPSFNKSSYFSTPYLIADPHIMS